MKALIIQGPQGSGKSTIARAIAGMLGTLTTVVDAEAFRSPFDIGYALKDSPHTLIVEGIDVSKPDHLEFLKVIATPGKIEVNQKMKPVIYIDAPNLIAVSHSPDPIKLDALDRRFVVLDTTNFYQDANQIHVTGSPTPADMDKLLASIKPGAITEVPVAMPPLIYKAINDLGLEAGVISKRVTLEQMDSSPLGAVLLVEVLREATLRQTRLSEGYERLRSVSVHAAEAMSQCLCDTGDEFSTRCAAAYQLTRLNREIADGLADRPAGVHRTEVSAEQMSGDVAHVQPVPPAIPEGYEMTTSTSGAPYHRFIVGGWTDEQLINCGYLRQIKSEAPAALSGEIGETRIQCYDENNPVLEVVVADRTYSFTVRNVEEDSHEWLMGVVSRQMQEIHDRAVHSTRQEIQTGMKKLLGIKL